MPRITNMYTVQKTLGPFFLIHKLECVHYCVQDVTHVVSRTWATFCSSWRADNNLVERGPISLTIAKSLDTRRATPSRLYLVIRLFPFFFIRTQHFLNPLLWWFFFFSKKKFSGLQQAWKAVILVAHQTFPTFLKHYNAFRVFHTSIETLITIMFLLFLVYLLDMVLSNICKSLGFESAFLPRIIGKVCDLCCLCPSWVDVVCILKINRKKWLMYERYDI